LWYIYQLLWLAEVCKNVHFSGDGGVASRVTKVLLVATHPDTSRTSRTLQGNYISSQAERLLTQLTEKFGALFDIHQQVLIVDAHLSNSPGMRAIKSYLADTREKVLQVWLSENASVIFSTFKLHLFISMPNGSFVSHSEVKDINTFSYICWHRRSTVSRFKQFFFWHSVY
jgi:hypothetical protein